MSKANSTALKDVSNEKRKSECDSVQSITAKQTTNHASARKLLLSATESNLFPSQDTTTPSAVIIDIDGDDNDKPLRAADLVQTMYQYWRSIELPIPSMENQTEVTARSRAILVGWVNEVQKGSSFQNETLYLIIGVIDRFLGQKDVPLDDLQLVGVGALLIGTKYEETWHYTIEELVSLCANTYSGDQILEIETDILNTLDFRLTIPSPYTFLIRFLKAACKDMSCGISAITTASKCILDMTLLSYHMNKEYLPSELAAMAVFLARKCMKLRSKSWSLPIWSETLWSHTGYSQGKVELIVVEFIKEKEVINEWGVKALRKKYNCVSIIDKLLHRAFISLK